MTKIIFLDTETTGLPREYYRSALEGPGNWPDLVSICWIIYEEGERVRKEVHMIRPNGFVIPSEASRIHGITQEKAEAEGEPLRDILIKLKEDLLNVDWVIAHNMAFDRNVLFHSFLWRLDMNPTEFWPKRREFCSMNESKEELCLPSNRGYRGYKNPSLTELYQAQFGNRFDGAHTADGDVEALVTVFWARWGKKV